MKFRADQSRLRRSSSIRRDLLCFDSCLETERIRECVSHSPTNFETTLSERDSSRGCVLASMLPCGRLIEKFVLGPGDGFMLRRQLKRISRRALW